ncbi:hypothetical protein [Algoriphagus pacificus]|uniref:Dolichyl-phosphate-mannose-protein mannosyltransferase n=1 Tax=Algoriphagus pacificus TaxID=2811234 RepID=A0ABS3CPF0_9BACT|nr:hypothetical protein [Algoriphagus pacificus]MBN7817539.1 hypothetical protein [Algoriphagus pacificus]
MMWLVSGAYTGTPESYAVFIHPILSWLFSKLYSIHPNLNLYGLTWFGLMLISYLVWLNVVFKRFNSLWTSMLWAGILLALLVHFLFFLQFSIVAGFTISAGLALRCNSQDKRSSILSYILISAGMLVRIEVMLFMLLVFCFLGFVNFQKKLNFQAIIIPSAILFAGYLLQFFWIYIQGLQDFTETNRLRSSVFDHPVLQLHQEELSDINPDLVHFSNGLMDFQVDQLSNEKLEQWKNYLDENQNLMLSFSSFWKALTYFILNERFLLVITFLFLFFAALNDWKSTIKTLLIFVVLLIGMLPFFLLKVQVYSILGLVFMLWMTLSLKESKQSKFYAQVFLPLLLIVLAYHSFTFLNSKQETVKLPDTLLETKVDEVFIITQNHHYKSSLTQLGPKFKLLGWPTLWAKYQSIPIKENRVYWVEKQVFEMNKGYFESLKANQKIDPQILIFD